MKNGGKYGESLAFCIWQEIDHFQTSEKQCAKAMQIHKFIQKNNILNSGKVPSNKADRKLPLILTLVFLCVGIVGLVILHNVVKGYLSDRRGAPFIPSFLCSFHQWRDRSRRNCNVRRSNYSYKTTNIFSFHRDDSETPISDNSSPSWFNRFRCWISRKLRYRGQHRPVNPDEAALEDEFCTEMSYVN